MSHDGNRRFGRPGIVIRETDDYVERRRGDAQEYGPGPEPEPAWSRRLLQPAVVVLLVACVIWPIAQFLPRVAQGLNPTLLRVVPVVMALVGFTTQRRVLRRLLSGTEATRFRLIELGILFLLVKLSSHLDNTFEELAAIAATWTREPLTFFDGQTIITFLLGTGAWWAAGATARDMAAVRDPTMYIGETGPRVRLANRYFIGGAILMVVAALTRVSVVDVLTLAQGRSRQPVISALIYFLVGLIALGVVRLTRLIRLWRRDGVEVADRLGATWLRYLLVFLGLVSAIAFVLPTGYTVGLLDLVSTVVSIVVFILLLLYMLLMWPITALMRLLMGEGEAPSPPAAPQLPFRPEPVPPAGGNSPVWETLRSVLFWVVLLAVVAYLVRSYLRDRPGLWRTVQRIRPRAWVAAAWRALRSAVRRWWASLGRTAARVVPALAERLRRRRDDQIARRGRDAGPTPREQIRTAYLRTMDTADEMGHPRRQAATPYEYEQVLTPHLADEGPALDALTEAFVEARYSDHAVSPEDADAQRANADRVIRELRRRENEAP